MPSSTKFFLLVKSRSLYVSKITEPYFTGLSDVRPLIILKESSNVSLFKSKITCNVQLARIELSKYAALGARLAAIANDESSSFCKNNILEQNSTPVSCLQVAGANLLSFLVYFFITLVASEFSFSLVCLS